MTDSIQSGLIVKPRRTRICGPQSKNGCFTCKARRIKCDEEKPTCLRCARSGRVCEGYSESKGHIAPAAIHLTKEPRADALLDRWRLIKTNPSWALKTGCSRSERLHRLGELGISLLSFDSFSRFSAAGSVLDILLPQLCHSIPSVNVALTALGAVHEMQASYSSGSPIDEGLAASQYQIALCAMQREVMTQPHGPIPLIMICFILGVTEILLQEESNAIFHLRCAFKLLEDRRNMTADSHPAQFNTLSTNVCSLEDNIEIISRTADFQTSSYALSKVPDLPSISVLSILPSLTDLSSAHILLVQLVHACYKFTSIAYKFKYTPHSASPPFYIEQGRHIAHLSTWLEQFSLTVLPALHQTPTSPAQTKSYSHALTLRMTALSTLIHLSCILSPYETSFDACASNFQQIVSDGEAIMSAKHREPDFSVKGIDGQRFTTGPGLIQPLFLTAFKYRHPVHRRRAIALLSLAGREGPWSGPREARVTARIMELEETWSDDSLLASTHIHSGPAGVPLVDEAKYGLGSLISSPMPAVLASGVDVDSTITTTDMHGPAQASSRGQSFIKPRDKLNELERFADMAEIAESGRLYGMGMSTESFNGRPSNRVIARFSRCRDVEGMLSYPCGHTAGQNQNLDSHLQGPCANNPYWEMWEEMLQF